MSTGTGSDRTSTNDGGRVIRIKSQNEASESEPGSSRFSSYKPKVSQAGTAFKGDKGAGATGQTEHEIYIPPNLKTGDEIIEARKTLKQRAGFNFEELYSAPIKVTGENVPRPCKEFHEFGFSDQILVNLSKCGFKRPTPIQEYVIPMIQEKRDVMACGQTGSGKTAAFILPLITTLSKSHRPQKDPSTPATPRALIISPVRELAVQIAKESQMYLTATSVTATTVYGGTSTSAELRRLKDDYTIIVATPGRLQQLLTEGKMNLENVEFVVVDEADKMLAGGFIKEIYNIYEYLPPIEKRTTCIFSATFPPAVQKLAKRFLASSYLFVVVGTVGGASYDVDQTFKIVEATDKYHTLTKIISRASEKDKIIVFCETRAGTQDLVDRLANEDLPVIGIHGEMFQSDREQALNQFIRKEKTILVASGLAARGLDIPHVTIVVNYDMPSNIDEYVQQIGRTGRIGNKGKAISFFEINRDGPMAAKLIGVLQEAGQPVPQLLEQVAEQERGLFNTGDEFCMMYPTADIRHFNALGSRPAGIPLPCEEYTETWD